MKTTTAFVKAQQKAKERAKRVTVLHTANKYVRSEGGLLMKQTVNGTRIGCFPKAHIIKKTAKAMFRSQQV